MEYFGGGRSRDVLVDRVTDGFNASGHLIRVVLGAKVEDPICDFQPDGIVAKSGWFKFVKTFEGL